MAGKETAGPRLTTSSGSCNVDLGTSSAATDLNHGRCTSSPWHALQDCVKFDIGCTSEPWEITGCTARTGRVTMAGKETARPYLTMSGGSFNVGQGTSSAASDLDFGRNSPPPPSVGDEATVAQKETARPYFTMSSGHCHLAQGTSSAPSDLDESRNPEGAWELPLGQHGNQAANTTLVCFQCRITFAYEEDFHDHMINHLTGIPEGARELPLGQQENLAADANLVCFKCGIAFNFSEAFQDHMTNHMIGMPAGTQQAEAECEGHYAGSSSNTCRACGKVFTEKWSLQRHLLTHTGRVTMAGKETARPYLTMSGGSCNVDQGTSSAASDLDNSGKSPPPWSVRDEATVARKGTARPYFTMSSGHYNLAPGTSSAPPYLDGSRVPEETGEAAWQQRENPAANRVHKCDVCQFGFTDAEALEEHVFDHWLGKNHNCSKCGKLFAHNYHLTRHLGTHGEPSFECGVCGKKYHTKGACRKHMRSCRVEAQDREAVEGSPP
ncbi:zinc finger protein 555-like isoform X2 [Dermacentor albipictus]|uniref:zinc finger protein 555-like isoform X2 n=1 Tax=Dermacentor albipictus TaxID=60249 RepID=UPI0031FDB307